MIDEYDVAELYAAMTGKEDPFFDDDTYNQLEKECCELYGVDFQMLGAIVAALMPRCASGITAITQTPVRGFIDREGSFICKVYDEPTSDTHD